MSGAEDSFDPAAASHRALRGIQRELERHPAVATVLGFPAGEFTQVVAHIAAARVDSDLANGTLTVRWFAGETAAADPEFSFHYSDSSGDVGWHHHPQEHVDGRGHVQERTAAGGVYTYEPYSFDSTHPTRVVWEVMAALTARLESA